MVRNAAAAVDRRLGLCIDSALIVALGLAGVDVTAAVHRGASGALALWIIAAMSVLPALMLGCLLLAVMLLDAVSARLELRSRRLSRLARALAALCAATPGLAAAWGLRAWPGLTLLLMVAAAIGVGAMAHGLGRRLSSSLAWLGLMVASSATMLVVTGSLRLLARMSPSSPDSWALTWLGLSLALPWVAACVALSGRIATGTTTVGPAPALAALVVGLALAGAGTLPLLASYPTLIELGFGSGAAVLAIAGTAVARAGRRAQFARGYRFARSAVSALAAAGWIALLAISGHPSAATWSLAHDAVLARSIGERLRVFDSGFDATVALLKSRPEAARGAAAIAQGQDWNASAPIWRGRQPRALVLITVDALRYDHAGYSGLAPAGLTPVLDSFARTAARFHTVYAQAPHTLLSLPSLMWSRYPKDIRFARFWGDEQQRIYFGRPPDRSTVRTVFTRASPRDDPHPTLAEASRAGGYATIAVANDDFATWFLPEIGYVRGFDTVVHPRTVLSQRLGRPLRAVDDALAADLVVETIAARGAGQFFLWVHFFGPHDPYVIDDGPAGFTPYQREVHHTDAQVGRVLRALDAVVGADERVVVITSDHGEAFGEHGHFYHGTDLYEESLRVPLLIAAPSVVIADHAEPVALLDLGPTLLGLAGIVVPESMHGHSLTRTLWDGVPPPDRPVFFESWRYEGDSDEPYRYDIGVRQGASKVTADLRLGVLAAYDLSADPEERHNLVGSSAAWPSFAPAAAMLFGWHDRPRISLPVLGSASTP